MASSINIELLEASLLQVPFESLKRAAKERKALVDEAAEALASLNALQDASREQQLAKIEQLLASLQGIKRKLGEVSLSEAGDTQRCKARLEHLALHAEPPAKDATIPWTQARLDRLLVDQLLRSGYQDSAAQLAKDAGVEDLVDLHIFASAHRVIDALRNHDCAVALAWCAENKARLRKIKSTLEFQLRIQEFLELVRRGERMGAVVYARMHLAPWAATHMGQLQQAIATLVFPLSMLLPSTPSTSTERSAAAAAAAAAKAAGSGSEVGVGVGVGAAAEGGSVEPMLTDDAPEATTPHSQAAAAAGHAHDPHGVESMSVDAGDAGQTAVAMAVAGTSGFSPASPPAGPTASGTSTGPSSRPLDLLSNEDNEDEEGAAAGPHERAHACEMRSTDAMDVLAGPMGQGSSERRAPAKYRALFADDRWQILLDLFHADLFKLHLLPPESQLWVHLQAGLSALKTHSAYAAGASKEDPLHLPAFQSLAHDLPYAKHTRSKLLCAVTRETMSDDNPPMVLPNGYVFSAKGISILVARNNGKVVCPITGLTCAPEQLRRAFIV